MKQLIQDLKTGDISIEDTPCPIISKGHILIETKRTLVSVGTEKVVVNFAKGNYLQKALQQPKKVKEVLNKVQTDGLVTTYAAVTSKLNEPIPLGYCNAGVVLETGVVGYKKGDRVISNGCHAEVVKVPQNLCAKIPQNVDDESAAFTVLAAVALQGIRLAKPALGEHVVVFGLGLVGLITVQMLIANGCKVLGIDFDENKCKLAKEFGAETVNLSLKENLISFALAFSNNLGIDAVLITASTKSDEVIHQAASMCRKRARIVLVGVVGMNINRDDFYEKELTLQVSASYGPGRYDQNYEEKGHDYPVGFVRWTEQRNFEAVLQMMSSGLLNLKPLISHKYDFENASQAYSQINDSSVLGIMLQFKGQAPNILTKTLVALEEKSIPKFKNNEAVIGLIGAGNYSSRVLIPALKKSSAYLKMIVTASGLSATYNGKKSFFSVASSNTKDLYSDEDVNISVIATRHNLHAEQVVSSLESGKNIFVEKPLAINHEEINLIERTYYEVNKTLDEPLRLMVGFNRRFSPHVKKIISLLKEKNFPINVIMTVNAGFIPHDHWTQDKKVGGGRIIGEVCHFLDLMSFLTRSRVVDFKTVSFNTGPKEINPNNDNLSISLSFEDGSFGSIHYFTNGGASYPKERVEIFSNNSTLQLDNYRVLKGFNWPGFTKSNLFSQNKGQELCIKEFIECIQSGKPSPIEFDEIIRTSRLAIDITDSVEN